MVWVKFLKRYSYKPKLAVTIDYQAGHANVPTACAREAIAAGYAVEEEPVPKPRTATVKTRVKRPEA